ncbi:MAG: phosphoribosyltransferase family protein [Pirellulaceae bacterium]
MSIGNYDAELQELVIRLKATQDESLAFQMGLLLGEVILRRIPGWDFDVVVPVPSNWQNQIRRPILLSGAIAEGVSRETGFPIFENSIQCVRKTAKQGTLDTPARFANVQDAFRLTANSSFEGKKVLIVDDVMTSGATADQVARLIRTTKARDICVATLARGARMS